MTILYRILFCPPYTNDEDKDLDIQKRIRQLNWVSGRNLECKIHETSVEVRELVYTSMMGKFLELLFIILIVFEDVIAIINVIFSP